MLAAHQTDMFVQASDLCEVKTTCGAFERCYSRVEPHMGVEAVKSGERLVADFTLGYRTPGRLALLLCGRSLRGERSTFIITLTAMLCCYITHQVGAAGLAELKFVLGVATMVVLE